MSVELREDEAFHEVPISFLSDSTKQSLEYDLYSADGQVLLTKGSAISDSLLERIRSGRLAAFKIGPKKKLDEGEAPGIISSRDLENLAGETVSVFNEIGTSGILSREAFSFSRKQYGKLLKDIDTHSLSVGKLVLAGEMRKLDSYIYQHAVNSGTLALIYGLRMRIPEEQLLDLVQAAFIFDVGLTRIPKEILNKAEPLSDRERVIINAHTRVGYHLLNEYSKNNPEDMSAINAKLTALLHHRKFNGKGYPTKEVLAEMGVSLPYKAIPQFTKITGICDMYSALEASRPYRQGLPPARILKMIANESNQSFEVKLVHSFINQMGPALNNRRAFYNPGDMVVISSETHTTSGLQQTSEIAVIEEIFPGMLMSPSVRMIYNASTRRRLNGVSVDLRNDSSRKLTRFIDDEALIAKFRMLM